MALCQKIIILHRAQWSIQSKQGEGTTIQIHFVEGNQKGEENHEQNHS